MAASENPLLRDRDIDFLLYEVLDVQALSAFPAFADHGRETYDLYLTGVRRLARDLLFPSYRAMDAEPPRFQNGAVKVHPRMQELFPRLVELGAIAASRPVAVGGQALPLTVSIFANAYLTAANLSAFGYLWLTTGAAHLLEAFGSDAVKATFMDRMYRGEWTGTMALTEPQAGSSLADVKSQAMPRGDGTYALRGSKIFISGGDQDLTDNIVHMVLARIEGAPPGTKGISLFAVPKRRPEGAGYVANDVNVAGVIHKIGWRGIPSVMLELGEKGDCVGWLVGEPHRGLAYMFQMMNEARISVGVSAAATASVAYHEALAYARHRTQGRPTSAKDPTTPPVSILAHADVRRMLLRQKAIVEGSLALVGMAARLSDVAEHGTDPKEKKRAALLLDALTPIAKTFPSEYGFEANALAVQVHGGYGYSSEYLVEAWLRDQKLNTLHEGTSGIQSLDLLGRRIVAEGGAPLRILREEVDETIVRATKAGLEGVFVEPLAKALATLEKTTMKLGAIGAGGDMDTMLRHSADYLQLASIVVVGWLWTLQAAVAKEALQVGHRDRDFYEGKLCAAEYFAATELPRVEHLASLCVSGESSYARVKDAWL